MTNSLITSNAAAVEGGGLVSLNAFIQVAATRFCGNSAPVNSQLQGAWFDYYANCVSDVCEDCPIPGDINLDRSVGGVDLAILLSAWGTDGAGQYQTDVVTDGVVNGHDLGVVLGNWGVTR